DVSTLYGIGGGAASSGTFSSYLTSPAFLEIQEGRYAPNPFEMNFIIQNTSNSEAKDVQAEIKLPAGLVLYQGEAAIKDIGTILVGEQKQVTWKIFADGLAWGTLTFVVEVRSSNAGSKSLNRDICIPQPVYIVTPPLSITSSPSGAKIYLDSTDTGSVTTQVFTNISPGTHTIKLTLSGYQDWYGTATVTAGSDTYVYATLTPVSTLTTTLAVFPEIKTAILGDAFTLQINLSDVPDFDSVGVYLSFDSQALEVISLTQGAFPAGGSPIISQFNNDRGTIDYAVGLTSGTAKGTGTVLTILFNPKAQGTTTLNIDFISPRKAEILNGINPIPFNHRNGTIAVRINKPPVAIISGHEHSIMVDDLVTLTGIKSYDPDGSLISYYWRQIAGHQITLANPTTGTITFIPVQAGNYAFELTVTDNMGAYGSAAATVMVTDTLLTISPANIEIGIENNFNLDIVLRKAKEFDSAGVYLSFDPNILEVTGLTQGSFPQDGSVIISQFNNDIGTIDYAVGLTSGTTQGTGTVLTIGFKAKAIMGTTTLNLNFDSPRNTDILKETESLSFTATGGKIIIFPCGSLDGYVLFDIPRQNPHAGIEIGIAGTELRAVTTDTGYFLINNIPPMTYPQVFTYAPGASFGYWGSVTITAGTKTTLSTLTLLNADANGDCMVSLKDFGCLKRAFLKTNTGSRWYDSDYHKRDGYVNSDFNGDDAISLKDFGYLKSNFLHTTTLYRSPLFAVSLISDGESAILKVVPEKREVITGAEFDINIDLLHAPTLDSVGAYLSFDPQALEVISLTQGAFPAGGSPIISQFNNESGTIDYAVGLTSGTTQGTGTVLTIKLKAKGTGTTVLNFDFAPPRDTEILNGMATVPLSTQIGTITGTPDTIAPTFTVTVSPDPSGIGTLTIIVTPDELLEATPTLTIKDKGNATITAALSGTYTYQAAIISANADGTATIMVMGTDLAGNMGTASKTFQISIPRILTPVAGILQEAAVTTTLQPFVVKVTDTYGNPIAGHLVHWQIIDSPSTATLSATTTTTGANGTTSSALTLGTKSGTYRVTASGSMEGAPLAQATFTATATPDTASSVEISAVPATILKGGTFTLTIIPKDKNGNVIASQGTVTLSNLTTSISPAIGNIHAATSLVATIALAPNGGYDVITAATVIIGANHVSGTCSILVLLPKDQGEIAVVLPRGTATAKGTFTDNFWIGIEDRSNAGTLTLLAGQIGAAVEITIGTGTNIITGTLPTTIFVEIPFDSAKLGNINRSTLKLWIYKDGKWQEIEDSGVYSDKNYVWGRITHLTLFGIRGIDLVSHNLTNVFAYPNPCHAYEGNRQITFKKLTAQANIKIFNMAGELVREIEHTNGTDEEVWTIPAEIASGVYIYLIADDKEQRITGKLGIIK
ncbi:MAG: PEGA domain-containing protein, partial [bacterium]